MGSNEPGSKRPPRLLDSEAMRFAGAGLELGGSAILFAAIGYAIDAQMGNVTLVATALGAVLGFTAGMYRFVRLAMQSNRQPRNAPSSHDGPTDPDKTDPDKNGS